MNDNVWQLARYALIAGGMYVAGQSKGTISASEVTSAVDAILLAGGSVVSAGTAAWGLYVKWRTRSVPEHVAARPDVPTVNTVTGAVEH